MAKLPPDLLERIAERKKALNWPDLDERFSACSKLLPVSGEPAPLPDNDGPVRAAGSPPPLNYRVGPSGTHVPQLVCDHRSDTTKRLMWRKFESDRFGKPRRQCYKCKVVEMTPPAA